MRSLRLVAPKSATSENRHGKALGAVELLCLPPPPPRAMHALRVLFKNYFYAKLCGSLCKGKPGHQPQASMSCKNSIIHRASAQ